MNEESDILKEVALSVMRIGGQEALFLELVHHPVAREELIRRVREQLQRWWNEDPEQIPRALYRIDVHETAARKALASSNRFSELAELIVNRLEQTARTRIAYRNRPSRDE